MARCAAAAGRWLVTAAFSTRAWRPPSRRYLRARSSRSTGARSRTGSFREPNSPWPRCSERPKSFCKAAGFRCCSSPTAKSTRSCPTGPQSTRACLGGTARRIVHFCRNGHAGSGAAFDSLRERGVAAAARLQRAGRTDWRRASGPSRGNVGCLLIGLGRVDVGVADGGAAPSSPLPGRPTWCRPRLAAVPRKLGSPDSCRVSPACIR